MTPKEKAKELFNKHYMAIFNIDSDYSEECLISILSQKHSLITVDELLRQFWDYRDIDLGSSYDYWQEVKDELNKL